MEHTLTWPPQYNIRRSKRTRRVSLKICEYNGLEVVLPYGVNEKVALEVLESNRRWVTNKLRDIPKPSDMIHYNAIPKILEFKAINECWEIDVQFNDSNLIRIIPRTREKKLFLQGPEDCIENFRRLLIKWLCLFAKKHFTSLLNNISHEVGLDFENLCIRRQKTRWGSCSSKKNINLNYKLIFMPLDYVRHIMLHELCHTVHMDHSKKFWQLLQSLDNRCDYHDAKTRNFKTDVTIWLDYLG